MGKRVLFTGGGSAGHVTPNLALIDACLQQQWVVGYIGRHHGIEQDLAKTNGIPYFSIHSGKLRRYFSWQNFVDPWKVLWGIVQSYRHCRRFKPDVLFSKGGFVGLPVVIGAWLRGIPVVVHESDLSPGLANRISYAFARRICLAFEASQSFFKSQDKTVVTGSPIRPSLFLGDATRGRRLCGFDDNKPVLFVVGGSLGAKTINVFIQENIQAILKTFQVIHLCGRQAAPANVALPGYRRFGYVTDEMADLLAAADIVISRAGANTIWELIGLCKPHLLIPLSPRVSRGDQVLNAAYFAQLGLSRVIQEAQLTWERVDETLSSLLADKTALRQRMQAQNVNGSVEKIINCLQEVARKSS